MRAACPERAAHCKLALPRSRASEQEARDVRTHDDEHEGHGAEQDRSRGFELADQAFVHVSTSTFQPMYSLRSRPYSRSVRPASAFASAFACASVAPSRNRAITVHCRA
jgi:hypothetical protein